MFNSEGLKKIEKIIKFLKLLQVFPFAWKESSPFLITYESPITKCIRVVFILFLVSYKTYLAFQFHIAMSQKVVDVSQTFWIVFIAAALFIQAKSVVGLQCKNKEMCFYFREAIGTYEHISCKYSFIEIYSNVGSIHNS